MAGTTPEQTGAEQAVSARVAAASAAHPKPPAFTPSFGTAGFRAEAGLLDSTAFR
jgi:hypothetical protein